MFDDSDKIFIPQDMEKVGSSGKLISDGIILGFIAILVGSLILSLATRSWFFDLLKKLLPINISRTLSLILAICLCFYLIQLTLRKLLLKEKKLVKMYEQSGKEIIDLHIMSDILQIDTEGVCRHSTGSLSIFLLVERGTTIQADNTELNMYLNSIKTFYDSLLRNDIIVKYYNLDGNVGDTTSWDNLMLTCYGVEPIYSNIEKRREFSSSIQKQVSKLETELYVLQVKYKDPTDFYNKVSTATSNLNNPLIKSFRIIKSEQELNKIGERFFNCGHFEILNSKVESNLQLFEVVEEDEYL